MSRILIATDAWHPQVNGVVRTLDTTTRMLQSLGHDVLVIEPGPFVTVAAPFYPEIRGALPHPGRIDRALRRFAPDHVHIATEGTIGWQVRRGCRNRGWSFTTSYHTRFPEYLETLAYVPAGLSYRILKRFHAAAAAMMVATPSLERELQGRGFTPPIRRWSRGVDLSLFYPRPRSVGKWNRPMMLSVGRVSYEKNVEDFLKARTPGTKVIVGDGPARPELQARYPDAVFLGMLKGETLAAVYADADLFVFPSRTDTFGIVIIEALASGLPVAAYPVTGPIDIITRELLGSLDADLSTAIVNALSQGDSIECAAEGRRYSWAACTGQFISNLVPCRG
jgi:glycosyltransferase involved in cell wall biosynthesis